MARKKIARNKQGDSNNFRSSDNPNAFAHLGFRFIYSMLSWFVLGMGVNQSSFFVSLFLFAIPICIDCLKFTPRSYIRNIIKRIELIVTSFWVVISVLGLAGVLVVDVSTGIIKTSDNFITFSVNGIPTSTVLQFLLSVVIVTLVDWLCKDI